MNIEDVSNHSEEQYSNKNIQIVKEIVDYRQGNSNF